MSALSDKILSLSPEYYYRFNQSWSTTPTNLGSAGTPTWTISNEAPTLNASGGIDGAGSWILGMSNGGTDTSATQVRISSTALTQLQDHDYTAGVWFKTNFTMTSTLAHDTNYTLFWVGGYGRYFSVGMTGGSANLTSKGKIQVVAQAGTTISGSTTTPIRVDDQQWHFFAIRVVDTGSAADVKLYLDGTEFWNGYYAKTTTGANYFQFGDSLVTVTANGASEVTNIEYANAFAAPSANITAANIAEIYQQGVNPATNISVSTLPLTASALQTEPTIAVTAGDHVEVTTSILVDASMGNAVAQTGQFVNISVVGTLDANIEMINNVDIHTSSDSSFSSLEMTATAEILQPFVARSPMNAAAESGNHLVYVTPNYKNMIKQLNPYSYFHDGKTASVNEGYQSGTFFKGADVTSEIASGSPMSMIAEGKSWLTGNVTNGDKRIMFETATLAESFNTVQATLNYTVEFWVKFTDDFYPASGDVNGILAPLFVSDHIQIDRYAQDGYYFGVPDKYNALRFSMIGLGAAQISANNVLDNNVWTHIVAKVSPGFGSNTDYQVFVNGSVVLSGSVPNSSFTPTSNSVQLANRLSNARYSYSIYFDEWALYSTALSNSDILQHYNFINSSSPDRNIISDAFTANIESGSHNFVVNSNATPEVTVATAYANIVNPIIIAGVSNDIAADVLTASATIVESSTQYGNTSVAQALVAYAESNNAFALSDTYYNYVMTNVNPYRYVTFDGANSFLDYGSDNDYAVTPVTIGGTVVNPDFGINGKSAKTAGTSYTTDGVILKESEWNDTWGTGLNNYHSSFWFRKADEDTSTGLRVLWNLNGHYDNQHVILYQYQNKLHLQFNNGSGAYIDQATASNYNLFDGLRHFVVVAFDHTGAQNRVNLFVDGIDIMTVDLGTYNGTTINGTVSVPANDEANNHPRLSVGCLITPFGSTALPVVPTNTIIYVDEVIWAKTSATQTLVSNLYGMMPGQTNRVIAATPLTASALATTATTSTSVDYAADWALAEAGPIDAFATVVRVVNVDATALAASAEMQNAAISWPANIIADIMVATVIFNNAGVRITIPGGPMEATVKLANNYFDGITVTTNTFNYPISMYNLTSPWAAWLRATDVEGIYPTREVV